ncbi:MAG TPA: cytochrome C oxidase subunit I [Burkholderiaceae bacterium]|nr:cytochrome C oxidase subunit I [Burkholderiaceae bacterium]
MDSASTPPAPPAAGPAQAPAVRRRQRIKLIALLLVFAAPVIASYLAYYVFPPSGRSNYGTLILPQRPVPELALAAPDGAPYRFASLLGQWVLLQVDSGACPKACADKLYALRQQRTMTGKDRERLDRVWLVTDAATPSAELLRDYEGTLVLRADPAALAALLPVEPGRRVEDYLYVIDPLGNLMMRFPADGEPARIRKDISRLLKASRVG